MLHILQVSLKGNLRALCALLLPLAFYANRAGDELRTARCQRNLFYNLHYWMPLCSSPR